MSGLAQQLTETWRLRYNRKLEECLINVEAIKSTMTSAAGMDSRGVTAGALARAAHASGRDEVAGLALLQASLARANGKPQISRGIIGAVEEFLSSAGGTQQSPVVFYLSFEKALNALSCGDYSIALEGFLKAQHCHAPNDLKLAAKLNALVCMDNLGLPCERTLSEVIASVGNPETAATQAMAGIRAHLDAFEKRLAFRKGELGAIFTSDVPSTRADAKGSMQSQYFSAWVAALPYHRYAAEHAEKLTERFLLDCAQAHQRGFRVRTLQGLTHPDDSPDSTLSDYVDRIYLWTWRWLQDPEAFPIRKVVDAVNKCAFGEKAERLTMEDKQLLGNSLLWLSVFDQTSEHAIKRHLEALSLSSAARAPLLSLEHLVIHWILARRDGKDHLASDLIQEMSFHPLWSAPDIYFRAIVEGVTDSSGDSMPGGLGALVKNMSMICRGTYCGQSRVPDRVQIVIDVRRGEIVSCNAKGGARAKTLSEPMALAFDLLNRKRSVTCEEFALVCFGIHRFDSLIHMSKVFNLLSRVRALLLDDGLTIKVKSGFVIADGSWEGIEIYQDTSVSRELRSQLEWQQAKLGGVSNASGGGSRSLADADLAQPRKESLVSLPDGPLTRQQIEHVIGRPRSTVNRIIVKWLKEKKIIREAHGPATRYRVNPKFREILKLGEVLS